MNKYLILGLVFLMLPLVFASDGCVINENCTWYAYGVTGEDGVNISFTYENETTTSEFAMISLGSGKYLYTTTYNVIGNIMGCARSYNSSGTVDTSCESKEIYFDIDSPGGNGGMSLAPIATLIAIAIISMILLYIAFKLDTEHIIWKFFIIMMVTLLLVYVPKAAIDSNQNCANVPVNASRDNGVLRYEYDLVCNENTETTSSSIYKVILWIIRAFFFYTMIYLFFKATGNLQKLPEMIERTFNRRKK